MADGEVTYWMRCARLAFSMALAYSWSCSRSPISTGPPISPPIENYVLKPQQQAADLCAQMNMACLDLYPALNPTYFLEDGMLT